MRTIIEDYNSQIIKFQINTDSNSAFVIKKKRDLLFHIFSIMAAAGVKPSKVKNGKKVYKLLRKMSDLQFQIKKLGKENSNTYIASFVYSLKNKQLKQNEKLKRLCEDTELVFPELIAKKNIDIQKMKNKASEQLEKLLNKIQKRRLDNIYDLKKIHKHFLKYLQLVEILLINEGKKMPHIQKLKKYHDLLDEIFNYENLMFSLEDFFEENNLESELNLEDFEKQQSALIDKFDFEIEQFIEICKALISKSQIAATEIQELNYLPNN